MFVVDGERIPGGPTKGSHGRLGHADITGEQTTKRVIRGEVMAQPKFIEQRVTVGDVLRAPNRTGLDGDVMTGPHLARVVIVAVLRRLGIRLERVHQRIIGMLDELAECGGLFRTGLVLGL